MLQAKHKNIVDAVLEFWFETDTVPGICEYRPIWFEVVDPVFDAGVRERFLGLYQRAAAGELEKLADDSRGALALVIILDQFSRNMFRGSLQRYATDAEALRIAEAAIERGFDRALGPLQRWFLYLPYQHSENLTHQRRSLALFQALARSDAPVDQMMREAAQEHLEIIERFGRFPNRNGVLGRETTAAEAAFIAASNNPHLTTA